MSRPITVLGLFTLSINLALGHAAAAPAPLAIAATLTNIPGPQIQFATPVYDFGRAKSGEPVKYTYYFTNTGDQVLEVTHVQPSCGCTTAGEFTKRVEPGKTGAIPIQFNPGNNSGQIYKTIAVTSTARNQNTVVLQLRGAIWKAIEFIPAYSVLTIPPDSPGASTSVRITNNLAESLVLFEPRSSNPSFQAELTTNIEGRSFELTITGKRPLAHGTVQGQVIIRTASATSPTISVPFWANVQPPMMIFPPQISLPPAPLARAANPTLTIQNNSTNRLTLSDASINVPGVDFKLTETQPGRIFNAVFTFPEGFRVPEGQQVLFTAKSSNPQMPLIKVPILQYQLPAGRPNLPANRAPLPPAPRAQASH